MDRVVEITPAEQAALRSSQASRTRLGKDLRRIWCAVLLCLLSVLVLALPIAYLLVGNLQAPRSCTGQVTEERGARFLKQRAVTTVTDTLASAEKPRAHLTESSPEKQCSSETALQMDRRSQLSTPGRQDPQYR